VPVWILDVVVTTTVIMVESIFVGFCGFGKVTTCVIIMGLLKRKSYRRF
jgi:hypothetical protein